MKQNQDKAKISKDHLDLMNRRSLMRLDLALMTDGMM